jgi:predicted dehydrogenase
MQVWSEQGFAAIDFGTRSSHFVTPCDAVLEHTFDYESLSAEEKSSFKEKLHTEILRVEPLEVESRNALLDELHDFVDSVEHQRAPRVTGAAGRDAVDVAERILSAIRQHQWEGRAGGPVGPLAMPEPSILRGPHWHAAPKPNADQREAG